MSMSRRYLRAGSLIVPAASSSSSSSSISPLKRDVFFDIQAPVFADDILSSFDIYTLPLPTNNIPGASDGDDMMTRYLSGPSSLPGYKGASINRHQGFRTVPEALATSENFTFTHYPALYHQDLCVDPRVTVGHFDASDDPIAETVHVEEPENRQPEVTEERHIAPPETVPVLDQPSPPVVPSAPTRAIPRRPPRKAATRRAPRKAAKPPPAIAIPRLTILVPSLPSTSHEAAQTSRGPPEHQEPRGRRLASSNVELRSPGSGADPGSTTISGPLLPTINPPPSKWWGDDSRYDVRGPDRTFVLAVQNDSRRPKKCLEGPCCTLRGVLPLIPTHPKDQVFFCIICEDGGKWLAFSTAEAAYAHLEDVHLEPLRRLGNYFVANPKYDEQLARRPNKQPKAVVFNCPFRPECVGDLGEDASTIRKHCAAHMNIRVFCTECDAWFANNSSLNTHRKDIHRLGSVGKRVPAAVVDGRPKKRARNV